MTLTGFTFSEQVQAARPGYGQDDDLTHQYCCDISVAMCGADLTNSTETDSDENECVVCCDLADMDMPCRPGCTDWDAP